MWKKTLKTLKKNHSKKRNNLCPEKSSPSNVRRHAKKANRLLATPPLEIKSCKQKSWKLKSSITFCDVTPCIAKLSNLCRARLIQKNRPDPDGPPKLVLHVRNPKWTSPLTLWTIKTWHCSNSLLPTKAAFYPGSILICQLTTSVSLIAPSSVRARCCWWSNGFWPHRLSVRFFLFCYCKRFAVGCCI